MPGPRHENPHVNFRISPKLNERVRAAAAERGLTFSEFARLALDQAAGDVEGHHHQFGPIASAILREPDGPGIIVDVIRKAVRQGQVPS